MMKKILAVALLFGLANSAFADSEDKGLYVAIGGGSTPSTTSSGTTTDAGSSYGAFLGYQFNRIFALEAGYTSLLSKANMNLSGTVLGDQSLSGSEVAAVFSYPVAKVFSPYVRVGSASMTMTTDVLAAYTGTGVASTTNTSVSGLTYGAGVQLNLSNHFGVRLGYNAYNLKDSTGTSATYDNAYGELVVKF